MKTLIRGAHIVDPANKINTVRDLLFEDGLIKAVKKKIDAPGAEVIDAGGLYLLPGLVDIHVHLREPGQEYKETVATGTRAAAAGGFTSVACMPNTLPVNDNASVTGYILEKAREEGVCRVYPVGAISKGQKGEDLAEMGELREAGCVAVSDDGHPVSSSLLMRKAMEYAKSFGLTVVSHCEDMELARGGAMNEGVVSSLIGMPSIPAEAEEIMAARDIMLARRTGAKLHLAHLSTAGSMELLKWGKASGVKVTGETAPHYFTLTEELVKTFDSVYKMNPPLRAPEDLEAITRALAEGTVDAIATDHAPHGRDEKEVEFEAAHNGIIGLETSLGLALSLYHAGKADLVTIIRAMTLGPSLALGIPAGTLSPGARADMVLVDLGAKWIVETGKFQSKARNCPFAGMELKGKAIRTITGGKTVYLEGEITAGNII